jgi:hypothetical protein
MKSLLVLFFLALIVPAGAQPTVRVGDRLPPLPGATLANLAGPKGLVLVVCRSADW